MHRALRRYVTVLLAVVVVLTGVVAADVQAATSADPAGPADAASGWVRLLVVRRARVDVRTVARSDLAAVLERLAADPTVLAAEPDRQRFTLDTAHPDDPLLPQQWGLPAIHWTSDALTRPAATVAVLDSGFDVQHRDLRVNGTSRFTATWNASTGTSTASPANDHGTGVASVVGATADDGFGMAGVAPSAPLLGVRIADATGQMWVSDEIAALRWATEHGARVINLSLGGRRASDAEHQAIVAATNAGALVVAAAGNDGCTPLNGPVYPAAYPEALAVGASDSTDAVACFSNHGPYVDVVAPGDDITVAVPGGGHEQWSGTSFAAPHVAGVAALVAGAHPDWSSRELATILRSSARDVGAPGTDEYAGAGLVDLAAAWTQPRPAPSEPAAAAAPNAPPASGPGAVGAASTPAIQPGRRDALEPNDVLRRAGGYPIAFDLRRTRGRALQATIARSGDAVDVYALLMPRTASRVRIVLRQLDGAHARLRITGFDRLGRRPHRWCTAGAASVVTCPRVSGRVFVRVVTQRGRAAYRLSVSRAR